MVMVASPLAAQTVRPERPYRGLFGGGYGKTEQSLVFNLTIGGGEDDNILLGGEFVNGGGFAAVDPRARKRSSFGNGSAGLSYSLSRSRFSLGANFGSTATYYPGLQKPLLIGDGGGVGATLKLWSGGVLTAAQSETYSPL
jgi:hypothetical protein